MSKTATAANWAVLFSPKTEQKLNILCRRDVTSDDDHHTAKNRPQTLTFSRAQIWTLQNCLSAREQAREIDGGDEGSLLPGQRHSAGLVG